MVEVRTSNANNPAAAEEENSKRDLDAVDWKKVNELKLFGVEHGVAAAYPRMVAQGFGHIVNTASLGGLVHLPGAVSYAAAKFGVVD